MNLKRDSKLFLLNFQTPNSAQQNFQYFTLAIASLKIILLANIPCERSIRYVKLCDLCVWLK